MSREAIKRWTTNLLSWKSRRRLLVIESDDWGMIRMASREAFKRLQARGYAVHECPYNTFDTLEAADDLEALTDTLLGFRDQRQRPPVLTANMVMGSPDFAAIRDAGFREFHVTPVWETLPNHGRESAIAAYRQAREAGVLRPQLHGRDHVAVGRWLEALQRREQRFVDAFDEGMFTVHPGGVTNCRRDLLDALGCAPNDPAFADLATALKQAQEWFVAFWGVPSSSFIAPCYTWHEALEPALSELGVRFLQGSRVQRAPRSAPHVGIDRKRHTTGQRNARGQRYIVRNVSLEPSIEGNEDRCLDHALVEVASAFHHRTPAIVSSHRLNYIGGLNESNRDRGLRVLAAFLKAVQRHWPDVEFVSTDELGQLMEA